SFSYSSLPTIHQTSFPTRRSSDLAPLAPGQRRPVEVDPARLAIGKMLDVDRQIDGEPLAVRPLEIRAVFEWCAWVPAMRGEHACSSLVMMWGADISRGRWGTNTVPPGRAVWRW